MMSNEKKQCWPILEQINFLSNAIYNSLIAEKKNGLRHTEKNHGLPNNFYIVKYSGVFCYIKVVRQSVFFFLQSMYYR